MKVGIFQAGYCTFLESLVLKGGRWKGIRFPAMFALLEHPRFGSMLFDTGYSRGFFEETRRFPDRLYRWLTPVHLEEEDLAVNQLAAHGIRPEDITRVFISHFHADHIAALGDFRRAKYVYLRGAFEAVKPLSGLKALSRGFVPGLMPGDFKERSLAVMEGEAQTLPPEYAPFTKGFDLLGDGSLWAVELPGHAAGQMGLFVRDEAGRTIFFVADAAWLGRSVREGRPPARMADLLFSDPRAYRETLSDLHRYELAHPEAAVIPSHCSETLSHYLP